MTDGAVPNARSGQPSLLGVGTVIWLASELMFFGGLFAAYLTLRSNARVWPPASVHLELLAASVATLVLIASSGTMHLATRALEHGERELMQRWLVVTLALGALFLVNQIREFFVLDFSLSSSGFGSMYYLMTGFHALHVFGGLIADHGRDRDHHRRRTARTPTTDRGVGLLLLALRRRRLGVAVRHALPAQVGPDAPLRDRPARHRRRPWSSSRPCRRSAVRRRVRWHPTSPPRARSSSRDGSCSSPPAPPATASRRHGNTAGTGARRGSVRRAPISSSPPGGCPSPTRARNPCASSRPSIRRRSAPSWPTSPPSAPDRRSLTSIPRPGA